MRVGAHRVDSETRGGAHVGRPRLRAQLGKAGHVERADVEALAIVGGSVHSRLVAKRRRRDRFGPIGDLSAPHCGHVALDVLVAHPVESTAGARDIARSALQKILVLVLAGRLPGQEVLFPDRCYVGLGCLV